MKRRCGAIRVFGGASFALLLASLTTMTACGSRPTPRPEVVGHRGASHDAPENTVAAAMLAWEQGADAVEVDVRLTADDRIVCLHDDTLRRTARVEGAVADLAFEKVRELDAGAWKDSAWKGERIPLLADVLRTVPEGKRIYVEIKCGPEIVPHLVGVLAETGTEPETVAIISFDEAVCIAVRKALPSHQVYLLSGFEQADDGNVYPAIDELVETATRLGLDGLDLSRKGPITRESVRAIHDAGLFLAVYTVNDGAEARRLRDAGVDAITTDRPGHIAGALAPR